MGVQQVPGNVPPRGVFFPQAARAVNNSGLQSPFMYSGFRATPSKPAYMGFGAQGPMRSAPHAASAFNNRTSGKLPNFGVGSSSSLPRAGGVYNGETWTGGSTIRPLGRPVSLNCFRPKDLRERLKIQDNLVAGLADEMKLDMPSETDKSSYSITRAIGELKLEIERCGLDNPFRIVLNQNEEIYLLENWGSLTIADVKYWCNQLDQTGCEFDAENLRLSAIKIKASLGASLSSRVATVTEADTPGPVLFKVAVDQVASLSAAKVRKLTTDLQGLSLKDAPAQSVPDITKKVSEIARQIDFSEVAPADLTSLVSKVYTTGSDTGFNHHAWGVYNSISTGFDHRPWREIVEGLVSFYEQQIQLDLYVPALGKKDSDNSIHGMLAAKLDRLEKKLELVNTSGNRLDTGKSSGPDNRKCYKCHAIGHLSRDCPSLKDMDPIHIPPNTKKGDSRERTRNNVQERWCGRCRDGKGLWNTGATMHYTEDHPKLPEATPSANPGGHTSVTAEANLGYIDAPFTFGFLGSICSPTNPNLVEDNTFGFGSSFIDGVNFSHTEGLAQGLVMTDPHIHPNDCDGKTIA